MSNLSSLRAGAGQNAAPRRLQKPTPPGVSRTSAGQQAPDGSPSEIRDRLPMIGSRSSGLAQAAFPRRSLPPRRSRPSRRRRRLVCLLLGPRGGDVVWIAIAGGSVLDQVVERPAALEVHKEQVTACVRTPGEGGQRR